MKFRILNFFFVGLAILVVAGWSSRAGAYERPRDFLISPAKIKLDVLPGTEAGAEILVTNRLGRGAIFQVTAEDIAASDDPTIAVKLLGDEVGKYSLRDFIDIMPERLVLDDLEQGRISVSVRLPADVYPGGHYAAVLISPEPGENTGGALGTLVRTRLGALILVNVPGQVSPAGSLDVFSPLKQAVFSSSQTDFQVRVRNQGNVHLEPFGSVRFKNILGRTVDQKELPTFFILPESTRTLIFSWQRPLAFGYYRAELGLNLGYDAIERRSVGFWVLPWYFDLTLLLAALLGARLARLAVLNWRLGRLKSKRIVNSL